MTSYLFVSTMEVSGYWFEWTLSKVPSNQLQKESEARETNPQSLQHREPALFVQPAVRYIFYFSFHFLGDK